jgi:hypothetical protein
MFIGTCVWEAESAPGQVWMIWEEREISSPSWELKRRLSSPYSSCYPVGYFNMLFQHIAELLTETEHYMSPLAFEQKISKI